MSYSQVTFGWPTLTPGIKLLLIVNGAVFVVNAILAGALIDWFGLSWHGAFEWFGLGLVRFVTYQFVHSWADPWHMIFNMLMLYFFGTMAEEHLGKRRTVRLYLAAGVVGGLVHLLLWLWSDTRDVPLVGASGSVYGLLLYATFLAPRARVIFIIFPLELWLLTAILVAYGLYAQYVTLRVGAGTDVAHGAHLGGALCGWLAYKADRPGGLWQRVAMWRRDHDRRQRQQRQATLDRLLEKVHRQGMDSLTGSERRFLRRASEDARRR